MPLKSVWPDRRGRLPRASRADPTKLRSDDLFAAIPKNLEGAVDRRITNPNSNRDWSMQSVSTVHIRCRIFEGDRSQCRVLHQSFLAPSRKQRDQGVIGLEAFPGPEFEVPLRTDITGNA